MKPGGRSAPEHCAQCGESIPPRALACPSCGADERTGWREQSIYDGLDLPEDPDLRPSQKRSSAAWGWFTGVILIVLLLILVSGALGLR